MFCFSEAESDKRHLVAGSAYDYAQQKEHAQCNLTQVPGRLPLECRHTAHAAAEVAGLATLEILLQAWREFSCTYQARSHQTFRGIIPPSAR